MRWGLVILLALALAVTSTGSSNGVAAGEQPPREVLRLRIVPNSNDREDQKLKLAVRDALLADLGPQLGTAATAGEARQLVAARLDRVAGVARAELASRGRADPVRVSFGRAWFPEGRYGHLVFPAGEYEALQVFIGEGTGANWWCVLFPPLCFVEGTTARAAGEEGDTPGPPRIRFKVLELLGLEKRDGEKEPNPVSTVK